MGVGAREGEGAGAGVAIGSDCAYGNAVHEYRDISWGEHEYRIHSFQYGVSSGCGCSTGVWGAARSWVCARSALLSSSGRPHSLPGFPGYRVLFHVCMTVHV